MRWFGSGAWAVACAWLWGCSGPAVYDRAPYSAGAVASVLFSNSLVVTRTVLPTQSAGALQVEYALLFQNEGAEAARLLLSEAKAELNDQPERATVRCAAHGYLPSAALSLPPGERLRLDCRLGLTAKGLSDARASDSVISFTLPVLSAGQLVTPTFEYRLKLEDVT